VASAGADVDAGAGAGAGIGAGPGTRGIVGGWKRKFEGPGS
jgi:hypothetical protein